MSKRVDKHVSRKSRDEYVTESDDNKQKMTYYEVLNVNETATLSEIKKQFRQMAIDFHPDNKKTGDATLFALVARAYECLSNSDKRDEYDKMLLIEKKTRKSNYISQKKAFEDFINAQENDPDGKKKELSEARYKLDFVDLDRKHGFDRKRYDDERDNPLSEKDTSRRMEDLLMTREQDDIEISHRKLFDEGNWNPDKFNEMFELKYKKDKNDLVKYSGMPGAFNDGVGSTFTPYENGGLYEDEGVDGDNYASLKYFDDTDVKITDDDIRKFKTLKGSKDYKGHNSNRGDNYQSELQKRLTGRKIQDELYDKRKINDFDTDPTMDGYGFLHDVGLTGRELEWDMEDVDDITIKRLIEFRKNGIRKRR
jgi:curved DNA-binding protein CbpA